MSNQPQHHAVDPLGGKFGIVTGAASGIGRATVVQAASEGARVLALDLDGERLSRLDDHEGVTTGVCDVSSEDDVARAFAGTSGESAGIDFLVNCAGTEGPMALIGDIDVAEWDRVMAINVRTMFLTMRQALPGMVERGAGSVVNIASIASFGGTAAMAAYAASKHAVIGLTKGAVAEVAEHGVRINALCPGPIDTEMQSRAERNAPDPAGFREHQEAAIPQRRYGRPEEVAALACFLIGGTAEYVNGVALPVDGGWTALL